MKMKVVKRRYIMYGQERSEEGLKERDSMTVRVRDWSGDGCCEPKGDHRISD